MKPLCAGEDLIPISEDFALAKRAPLHFLFGLICLPLAVVLILNFKRQTYTDLPLLLVIYGFFLTVYLLNQASWHKRKREKWYIGHHGFICKIADSEKIIQWNNVRAVQILSPGIIIRYEQRNRPEGLVRVNRLHLYLSPAGIESFQENLARFKKIRRPDAIATTSQKDFLFFLPELGLTTVAVMVLGWTVYTAVIQYHSYDWPVVNGIVTLSKCEESKVKDGAHLALTYQYAVEGKTYQSSQFGLWRGHFEGDTPAIKAYALAHPEGGSINVYYDPNHSEVSVIERGPAWATIGSIVAVSIGVTLLAWFRRLMPHKSTEIIIYSAD